MQDDVKEVFLDCNEFAKPLVFDGQTINAVIEWDDFSDKGLSLHQDGVFRASATLNVAKADLLKRPLAESRMNVDGRRYFVIDCREEEGMYIIRLQVDRQ